MAPEPSDDCPTLVDWKQHWDSRKRKVRTAPTQLNSRLEDLVNDLKGRGYKELKILPEIEKTLEIPRKEAMARVSKKSEKEKMIVLPIPFNPRLPDVSPILRQFWQVAVERNPAIKTVMKTPPIPSYRRPKNLRDEVVQAKVPKPTSNAKKRNQGGFKRCLATRCYSCSLSRNTKKHTAPNPSKSWPIYSATDCNTSRGIYTCRCKKGCPGSDYVGKTSRPMKARWTEHRSAVKPVLGDAITTVGKHFSAKGHSVSDMEFCCIEKVRSEDPFVLKAREAFWIREYDSINRGLNVQE